MDLTVLYVLARVGALLVCTTYRTGASSVVRFELGLAALGGWCKVYGCVGLRSGPNVVCPSDGIADRPTVQGVGEKV